METGLQTMAQIIRDTLMGVFSNFTHFVPLILGGILILLLGWLLARFLRGAALGLCQRIKLDEFLERQGITANLRQVGLKSPPSSLVAQLLYWIILLNFLLAALQRMNLTEAILPLQAFIGLIPSLVAALVTFVLGSIGAQFVGRVVSGGLKGIGIDFHETLGNVVQTLILCIVFIISLQQIGLDVNLLTDLFVNLLIIGLAGVALAFGIGGRDVARNVLAGFYARELFHPGDHLQIDGHVGVLEGIGTVNSEIRLENEGIIVIPNTRLTDSNVYKMPTS